MREERRGYKGDVGLYTNEQRAVQHRLGWLVGDATAAQVHPEIWDDVIVNPPARSPSLTLLTFSMRSCPDSNEPKRRFDRRRCTDTTPAYVLQQERTRTLGGGKDELTQAERRDTLRPSDPGIPRRRRPRARPDRRHSTPHPLFEPLKIHLDRP